MNQFETHEHRLNLSEVLEWMVADGLVAAEVAEALAPFVNARDFVWCQEEPQNQGAWYCSQHHFWAAIPQGASLKYAGRAASAAPACGYAALHLQQQNELIQAAFS